MFVGSDSGHVNWFTVALDSDIENHDSTVIKSDSDECWMEWMEVQAHDIRLSLELILWPDWVLDGVAADKSSDSLQEIIRTVTDSKKIWIFWIPLDGSYMFFARFIV